jgi:hypothetical protein
VRLDLHTWRNKNTIELKRLHKSPHVQVQEEEEEEEEPAPV